MSDHITTTDACDAVRQALRDAHIPQTAADVAAAADLPRWAAQAAIGVLIRTGRALRSHHADGLLRYSERRMPIRDTRSANRANVTPATATTETRARIVAALYPATAPMPAADLRAAIFGTPIAPSSVAAQRISNALFYLRRDGIVGSIGRSNTTRVYLRDSRADPDRKEKAA